MEVSYEDIDPMIRGVVGELNHSGYITMASCAGHGGEDGMILFVYSYNHRGIRRILERFGLKVKHFEEFSNPWYPKPRTVVHFGALGGEAIEIADVKPPYPIRSPSDKEIINWLREQGYSGSKEELDPYVRSIKSSIEGEE